MYIKNDIGSAEYYERKRRDRERAEIQKEIDYANTLHEQQKAREVQKTGTTTELQKTQNQPEQQSDEEQAKREQRFLNRRREYAAYRQEMENERKKVWQQWKSKSAGQKVLCVVQCFNPGAIDVSLNRAIENSVDAYSKRQLAKPYTDPCILFGLKMTRMAISPFNRISERIFSRNSVLILSALIAIASTIFVFAKTGSTPYSTISLIAGFYSLNIIKIALVWCSALFFNCIYRVGGYIFHF